MAYTFFLSDLVATEKSAKALAAAYLALPAGLPLPAIFFRGDLGAGKTTFTRCLVQALPEGQKAEVSSPSFTLCNTYDSVPKVVHCDLYRCAYALPEDVWDALDDVQILTLIEWAEYLPADALPKDYLDFSIKICEEGRLLEVASHGQQANTLLEQWKRFLDDAG